MTEVNVPNFHHQSAVLQFLRVVHTRNLLIMDAHVHGCHLFFILFLFPSGDFLIHLACFYCTWFSFILGSHMSVPLHWSDLYSSCTDPIHFDPDPVFNDLSIYSESCSVIFI